MGKQFLAELGIDIARLEFALRTAIAACIALFLAWLLGLEHPQWAGMTVWAASQPLRGQLLEKSFFRFAGTVIGTIVGVLLVMLLNLHPALLVIGLSAWVGLCTGLVFLVAGFVSYGTVLAGYTAAMVALLDSGHPENVWHLGADRMATVLIGVLIATLIGYFLAPASDTMGLQRRVNDLLIDLLDRLTDPHPSREKDQALLLQLAVLDESLDAQFAGLARARPRVRATRSVLLAAVSLLFWRSEGRDTDPALVRDLEKVKDALRDNDLTAAQHALIAASADTPQAFRAMLADLAYALQDTQPGIPDDAPPRGLHRDLIGAKEAGLRAAAALLIAGAIWVLTGWTYGGYMMLGLSVMISVFARLDNISLMMRNVFLGQLGGALVALFCKWVLWPHATQEYQLILMIMPLILLGALVMAHRKSTLGGFDFNMVLLLMLQPHWPLTGTFGASLAMTGAVLIGPLAAWLGYRLIYPITLQRRQDHVLQALVGDVVAVARSPLALSRRRVWRARLYHRVLRLIRMSEMLARAESRALELGLAFMNVGHTAMRCHEIAQDSTISVTIRRAAGLVLARLSHAEANWIGSRRALRRLAALSGPDDARLFQNAAMGIELIRNSIRLEKPDSVMAKAAGSAATQSAIASKPPPFAAGDD